MGYRKGLCGWTMTTSSSLQNLPKQAVAHIFTSNPPKEQIRPAAFFTWKLRYYKTLCLDWWKFCDGTWLTVQERTSLYFDVTQANPCPIQRWCIYRVRLKQKLKTLGLKGSPSIDQREFRQFFTILNQGIKSVAVSLSYIFVYAVHICFLFMCSVAHMWLSIIGCS